MSTPFFKSTAPWSHDWAYEVKSLFGDPDEDEPSGAVVSIKADSDEQAEQRVIDYATQNFDDDFYGDVAISQGSNGDGTYTVRIVSTS
jgi:hypothetical protein